MADLLAIIAHDPAAPVPEEALDGLVRDYETLRGTPRHTETVEAPGVRACVLRNTAGASTGVERGEGDAWSAWAGSVAPGAAATLGPLEALDGQFALVRREGEETVLLAADPLGLKPLFVATQGRSTFVSTSALVLARHLRLSPSRLGLESFLRTGVQFGRATQWEGLERLQAAEWLRFGRGGGTERGVYWRPRQEEAIGRLSLPETAELCLERAVAAIGERFDPDGALRPPMTGSSAPSAVGGGGCAWLDLTGGFDSRLLALLCRQAGIEFRTNTVGEPGDEDVRLGREVAARGGWSWTRLHLSDDWSERLPALASEAVGWGDGHLDSLSLARVLHVHRAKAKDGTRLMNGGGAEELRDYPWAHELLGAGRSTEVSYDRLLAWRILLSVDLSALRADPTPAVATAIRGELERHVAPFAEMPNTFKGDMLYAFKTTGHFGAYQAVAGDSLDLELPFYLRPILLSAISVAPGQRRFHRLMREMMRQLDPAIAAIQTETGGPAEPPRPGNLHRFAPYAWRRARRFGGRLSGRLPRPRGDTSREAVGQPLAARAALIGAMRGEGRLDPHRMRAGALYDPSRLDDLLDRAAAQPGAVDWDAVGRIVTVELALEAADAGLA